MHLRSLRLYGLPRYVAILGRLQFLILARAFVSKATPSLAWGYGGVCTAPQPWTAES